MNFREGDIIIIEAARNHYVPRVQVISKLWYQSMSIRKIFESVKKIQLKILYTCSAIMNS